MCIRFLIPAVLLGTILLAPVARSQENSDTLPITRAVLFSSGVGYFEHEGSVSDDATMTLNFKAEQINDILKSMVLMDLDGGSVSSVTYPSNDPVARALRSFEIDISGNPTLAQLLGQLRGEMVTVTTSRSISGKILNVEMVEMIVGEPRAKITKWKLNLLTDSGIQSVFLDELSNLKLADEQLQSELNKALALLVSSRDKDRKPVDIKFVGKGKRKVRVGYLVETPVWKTSYRLDLSDDKPLLQGWAIVENTSDNDWQNVKLSLVSGRPISFVQDLYTPLYLPRPVVQPELYASLTPRKYDEGVAGGFTEYDQVTLASATPPGAPRKGRMKAMDRPMANAKSESLDRFGVADRGGRLRKSGVASVASAQSVGELFSFDLKHPVDLSRRRSAMLPIVNKDVQATKVSIYNQGVMPKHPLNGVRLKNTSGIKLMAGPITVFDGGSYAGDAQIDHLAVDEERLLSYAVDLDVTIDPSARSNSTITTIKIVRGIMQVTRKYIYEQTYLIKNKAKTDRTIVVEQRFYSNRTLVKPEKPTEKTASLYRFDVTAKADKASKFEVVEEQVDLQHIAVFSAEVGTLLMYSRQGNASDGLKKALTRAIELKNELAQLERTRNEKQNELRQIENGQDRLRRNISTVGQTSELGKRYIKKLDEQETQIENLQKEIDDLNVKALDKRKQLEDYVSSLNVE